MQQSCHLVAKDLGRTGKKQNVYVYKELDHMFFYIESAQTKLLKSVVSICLFVNTLLSIKDNSTEANGVFRA